MERDRDRREGEGEQSEDEWDSPAELLDDFQIASELQAALLALAPSTGLRVDIDVDEGVVYLRGEVASRWQKEEAGRIVRAALRPGLKGLRNQLVVNPALPSLFRP